MKCSNVVLIHGNWGATSKDIWFPYVKKEIETMGVEVISHDFPDAVRARQRYWMPYLIDTICPDENSIIVGHSSGGLAALRFAEEYRLLGTALVATQLNDCGIEHERLSGFFETPFRWNTIKNNQEWILQFHSKDDPWISLNVAREINENLDSEYFELDGYGHFGKEGLARDGFPMLVQEIRKKIFETDG